MRGVQVLYEKQKLQNPDSNLSKPRGPLLDNLKKKLDRRHAEMRVCKDKDKGIGRLDSMFACI
jgi:hypothetical protein